MPKASPQSARSAAAKAAAASKGVKAPEPVTPAVAPEAPPPPIPTGYSQPMATGTAFQGGGFAAFAQMNAEAKARQEAFEKSRIQEVKLDDGEQQNLRFLHLEPWPIQYHTIAKWNTKWHGTDYIKETCPRKFDTSTDKCAYCESSEKDDRSRTRSATFLVLAYWYPKMEKNARTGKTTRWKEPVDPAQGGGTVMILRPTKKASIALANILPKKGINRVYTLRRDGEGSDSVYTIMNEDQSSMNENDLAVVQDFAQTHFKKDAMTEQDCLNLLAKVLAPRPYEKQIELLGRTAEAAENKEPEAAAERTEPGQRLDGVPFSIPPEVGGELPTEQAPRRPAGRY